MAMSQVIPVDVNKLAFDRENPRLAEFSQSAIQDEREIIRVLWENMDVEELVMSISASGFFRHEPLIVIEDSDQYIVIEGNRRLAAVRLLLTPSLAEELEVNIPTISEHDRQELTTLPCLLGNRKDTWQYLGFKHVNGAAKWSSYAKSKYIADVHLRYSISLQDIARQIGDTHNTVLRLFQGLMVIRQAEEWNVFLRTDRRNSHFSFSHLYTGITYPGISSYIGLAPKSDEDPAPVPLEKKSELGTLCLWLYGSKRQNIQPVIRSQNPHLRQLDAVLSSRAATAHLINTDNIQSAFSESRPPTNRFEEYLESARDNLRNARAILSDGYDGSNELLEIGRGIVNTARDVYDDMLRKQDPNRP